MSMTRLEATITNLEGAEQALVDRHHSTGIVKLSTVVGRTEQGDQLALGEEFVAILDHLVGAANQIHVVLLEEARDHIGAEREGHSAIVLAPSSDVLIGVRPQKVAEQATVRNLQKRTGLVSRRPLQISIAAPRRL